MGRPSRSSRGPLLIRLTVPEGANRTADGIFSAVGYPTEQRRGAHKTRDYQKDARCGKQSGGDGIGGNGAGRLTGSIAQIGPRRKLDLAQFERQRCAQQAAR